MSQDKKLTTIIAILLLIAVVFVSYVYLSDSDDEYEDELPVEATANIEDSMDSFEDIEYEVVFNNSFEHTKPGEYSEIIVDVSGLKPGEFTIMYVRDAKTKTWIEAGGQEITADENGRMQTRFRITSYGDYEVWFSRGPEEVVSPVITVN